MADIYQKILTGNLTDDAKYTKLDREKSPINFTIATNFANDKTIFTNCVYWIPTKENPEVLKYLKKGTKLTVSSNYVELESWESDTDGQKKYRELTYVSQFVFSSSKIGQAESTSVENGIANNAAE